MADPGYAHVDLNMVKAEGLGPAFLCAYFKDEGENREMRLRIDISYDRKNVTLGEVDDLALMESGWCPFSVAEVQNDTGITPSQQNKWIKELEQSKHIVVKRKGCPPRRLIHVNSPRERKEALQ